MTSTPYEILTRLRTERITALLNARHGLYGNSHRRPAIIRALGCVLLPETVTDAWYAAECPPRLDAKVAGISRCDRFAWRISMFLRGCPGFARSS